MKRMALLLLALALLCATACAEIGLTSFTAVDTDGNTITEEIFADYDVTMVNYWATWCGFCMQELPEFAKLKEMLPENANLITICDDAEQNADLMAEMLASANANYTTIVPSEQMYQELLGYVTSFPTTVFLDRNGVMCAKPCVGVPSMNDAANAYLKLIQEALDDLHA